MSGTRCRARLRVGRRCRGNGKTVINWGGWGWVVRVHERQKVPSGLEVGRQGGCTMDTFLWHARLAVSTSRLDRRTSILNRARFVYRSRRLARTGWPIRTRRTPKRSDEVSNLGRDENWCAELRPPARAGVFEDGNSLTAFAKQLPRPFSSSAFSNEPQTPGHDGVLGSRDDPGDSIQLPTEYPDLGWLGPGSSSVHDDHDTTPRRRQEGTSGCGRSGASRNN